MSHASNLAIHERGVSQARTAKKAKSSIRDRRAKLRAGDAVLDRYLKRIDPAVAASFTHEQRAAMKIMLGARGVTKHLVEVRRSIPLGRRRFYMVFLLGAERRSLARLYSEGRVPNPLGLLILLGLAALFMAPMFVLLTTYAG